jgi:hypothetical protein
MIAPAPFIPTWVRKLTDQELELTLDRLLRVLGLPISGATQVERDRKMGDLKYVCDLVTAERSQRRVRDFVLSGGAK